MKITTHTDGGSYFYAEVDGRPIMGERGGVSKFQSRKDARDEAERRMAMAHNKAVRVDD